MPLFQDLFDLISWCQLKHDSEEGILSWGELCVRKLVPARFPVSPLHSFLPTIGTRLSRRAAEGMAWPGF
jgi:hypothetical protein